jgi:glycosyltransferase involved in cell wall biosynthesis
VTATRPLRLLLWHVHGSWTTSFVQGRHRYFVPVLPDRGPDGLGRAQTWDWPESVEEVTPAQAAGLELDAVILQRPGELAGGAASWLGGRRPGIDLPAVYLEHNAPQGRIADLRHPAAGAPGVTVVHVTHFNDLFWDTGATPTRVIEHGVIDPGYRYTGELPRIAVTINDPVRRGRVTGTDLLPRFAAVAPLDLFGMGVAALGGIENLPQHRLHQELPRRRVYVHTARWTSLGLSLIEAMMLGMPVVALGTTAAPDAVPAEAGAVSTDVEALSAAAGRFVAEPEASRLAGKHAREAALARFGIPRFLADWDALLAEVTP